MKQRVYAVGIAFGIAAALLLPCNAAAEVSEVRIARGFAIPHLPIMVMEHEKLLEKHAKAGGLGDIRATYSTTGGGSVMNDALLSGSLSFGVGGPPPMLTLWDNSDKPRVAQIYLEMTGSKEKPADILAVLDDPQVKFTMTPEGTMKFAGFMHRIGSLKTRPASWKDYFFDEIHDLPGS